MKRKISLLLCTIMAAAALGGCGSSPAPADSGNSGTNQETEESKNSQAQESGGQESQAEQVTLRVGGWPAVECDDLDRLNALKEQFEKDNPNITIVPDTFGYDMQIFQAKAAAGELPDLLPDIAATEVGLLAKNGYLADLDDAFERAGYMDKINKAIISQISYDGKIYSLPISVYAMGLMYDTSLMREAGLMNEDNTPQLPETWEDMAKMAVQIKEKTGQDGFAMPTINNQGGWMFVPIAWSYGVDFMEQDENGKWQATFDTPEAVEALEFIKSLKWEYDVFSEDVMIDYAATATKLASGQLGITPMAPDMCNVLADNGMAIENVGIMPMPSGPAKRVALSGGGRYCMTAGVTEAQKDAALKWLEARGCGWQLTDVVKKALDESMQNQIEKNAAIGIRALPIYSEDAEVTMYNNQLIEDNCNIVMEQVQAYNAALTTGEIEYQLEEPVECQRLYGLLDGCVQEVLTNENADCAALIADAAKEFQVILDQQE